MRGRDGEGRGRKEPEGKEMGKGGEGVRGGEVDGGIDIAWPDL